MALAVNELFSDLIEEKYTQQDDNIIMLRIGLIEFNNAVTSNITDVIECKAGSMAICLLPKLITLPLLLHPLFIPLHKVIKRELDEPKTEMSETSCPFK